MRVRSLLAAAVALCSLPLLALDCVGGGTIQVLSPTGDVTTPSFTIEFKLVGGPFTGTPEAFLNLQPLVVSGGPTTWTASVSGGPTVDPGAPLQDENLLILRATRQGDGVVVKAVRSFAYAPSKARVFEIADLADCPVSGPLAHARVGDYCLQNDEARFVVQDVTAPAVPTDPTPRDLYSVGAFGGNIIDAVLVSDPTNDNFLEVQPMLNVETVTNHQTITVVNDGQDGTAAILRTCGPDDLLDFANPSSQLISAGFAPPNCPGPDCFDDNDQPIEACTTYRLEPGDRHVTVETEVMNNGPVDLRPLVGDWMNAAGEVDGWFKPNQGIGEAVFNPNVFAPGGTPRGGGMGWFAETGADGPRFEYGYVPLSTQLSSPGPGSYVTVSGVTVILHDINAVFALTGLFPPPFLVPAGGSNTYTRFFQVGDGTANGVQELANEIYGVGTGTVQGCVTVGGAPAVNAKVTVASLNAGALFRVLGHFVTDASGCYEGEVEVPTAAGTDYGAVAALEGALFEGGAATPPITTFELFPAGDVETLDFALPAAGTLEVTVADASGSPVPARVTVVGFDPSPEPTVAGAALPGFGGATLGIFNDVNDDQPFGVVAFQHTGADGVASLRVEPGSYHVTVSRGTEYSAWSAGPVVISGGSTTNLAAQIARVVDTPDFISSDFHVHGITSADSQVAKGTRAVEFAGEGVENLIATDHHVHTDYAPAMAAAGLSSWVTSTVGEEITTFDYGHFNGYPFLVDPSVPSGGSTDWAVAAPPGEDFPSFGAYNLAPGEIFTLATSQPEAKASTTLQVNHIDSHFEPLRIDTSQVPPVDDLSAADRAVFRLDPASPPLGQLFHPFPALEVWNGMTRSHQGEFLDERIGIWMNLLDQDIRTTAIADTDTHTFRNLRTAGARTWTATSPGADTPLAYDEDEMAASVDEGRAVGGQGVYVQARLLAGDGSGNVADLSKTGSTAVSSANGEVTFEVTVQSPSWAQWDTIEIYTNAGGNVSSIPVDPLAPYLYTAAPLVSLQEGDCDPATDDVADGGDFDISVTNVAPAVPGGVRHHTTVSQTFTGLASTTWFVAVVKGTDGVCAPMFPVFATNLDAGANPTLADLVDGNVGEGGVMALGFTNALYFEP